MVIFRNSLIPFPGFKAMYFYGILFVRGNAHINEKTINHEKIHEKQLRDLLYLFYYPLYVLEWLFRVLFTKDRFSKNAYRNISFEQEAFAHEYDFNYLKRRKWYAMWRKETYKFVK